MASLDREVCYALGPHGYNGESMQADDRATVDKSSRLLVKEQLNVRLLLLLWQRCSASVTGAVSTEHAKNSSQK